MGWSTVYRNGGTPKLGDRVVYSAVSGQIAEAVGTVVGIARDVVDDLYIDVQWSDGFQRRVFASQMWRVE